MTQLPDSHPQNRSTVLVSHHIQTVFLSLLDMCGQCIHAAVWYECPKSGKTLPTKRSKIPLAAASHKVVPSGAGAHWNFSYVHKW